MDLSVCFWILWGSNYTNNKPVKILKSHLAVAMSHEGEVESLQQLFLCPVYADLDSRLKKINQHYSFRKNIFVTHING